MEEVAKIVSRVSNLERRVAGSFRRGKVAEVDPSAGTVRLEIGQGPDGPDLSPAIPYAQLAGALKVHAPPSVGQQMVIMSEGGDFRQGVAFPMTWSNANPSPGDTGDENVITFGAFRIGFRGDALVISGPKVRLECDGATFELTGGGLVMVAPDYDFQ